MNDCKNVLSFGPSAARDDLLCRGSYIVLRPCWLACVPGQPCAKTSKNENIRKCPHNVCKINALLNKSFCLMYSSTAARPLPVKLGALVGHNTDCMCTRRRHVQAALQKLRSDIPILGQYRQYALSMAYPAAQIACTARGHISRHAGELTSTSRAAAALAKQTSLCTRTATGK